MPDSILVPMDGSEQAVKALSEAIDAFPKASITVLYVARLPTKNIDEFRIISGGDWQSYKNEAAQDVFERANNIAEKTGTEIETVVAEGEVAKSIIEYADEFDWIVIGSHGREGVARVLLGSVAEKVVRRSPIPVTVVR